MTLCIAWVRASSEGEELIFATDSCLAMGERWESGVKLFELPRKDCLICFSGYTFRTYPLILNLINSLKYDKYLSNTKHDISSLIEHITKLFTDLIKNMKLQKDKTYEHVLREDPPFDFLFGGWSWKEGKLKLWRIYYNYELHSFAPEANYQNLVFAMIGDNLDEATEMLEQEIANNKAILKGRLEMEPLKVLVEIIREPKFTEISGAVQLAKIYPPGEVEFFGVYYPSVEGRKTFLGRDVSQTNNAFVRFIDPDTGTISELKIPNKIEDFDLSVFGDDKDFIADCYPSGTAKDSLTEKEKDRVQSLLKEYSYKNLIDRLNGSPDEREENRDDE